MVSDKLTTLSKKFSKITIFRSSRSSTNPIAPGANEDATNIFHPFPRLPFELRNKIWKYYLDDEEAQLYRVNLRYPYRRSLSDAQARYMEPGDCVLLEPVQCLQDGHQSRDPSPACCLQPLRELTRKRRTASMACVESQQIIARMYPDSLSFRVLPAMWPWRTTSLRNNYRRDGTDFPKYTLRFNGAKDIFVFNSRWEDLDATVKIATHQGFTPVDLAKMRHVGIAVNDLRSSVPYRHGRTSYGTWKCEDNCASEACADHCKLEPLPEFLSLFPLLETFYIAAVPDSSTHQLGEQFQAGSRPSSEANCPCPVGEPRHSWKVISSSQACGWFIIYDESSPCPFPTMSRVEELRRRWRPHFPYYEALNHLQIKFIQSLLRPCERCGYQP